MYDILPRNIVGRPVAAGDHGHRLAARNGNAAVKPFQLQGDLALVVVHGDHAVKAPPKAFTNRMSEE